jgi:hypothetical protein
VVLGYSRLLRVRFFPQKTTAALYEGLEGAFRFLLNAVTGEATAEYLRADGAVLSAPVEPLTNYFASRLRRDLRAGSTVLGSMIMATNRASSGGNLALQRAGSWDMSLRSDEASPGFEINDLGFQGRVDYRSVAGFLGRPIPEQRGLLPQPLVLHVRRGRLELRRRPAPGVARRRRGGLVHHQRQRRRRLRPDPRRHRRLAPDRRPASAAAFRFDEPNFNVRSLRGNAVLRWEYRPGSTLFFVWQQERSGSEPIGDFAFRRDAAEILAAPATNVLLIKATYWLGADSARAPGGAQPGSPPARRRGGLRPQPGAPLGAHPAGAASARPAVSQARLDSGRRAAGRA